jgi:hypothetical protein
MDTAISILKKARKKAQLNIYFARATMSWFKLDRWRKEKLEIEKAIKILEDYDRLK